MPASEREGGSHRDREQRSRAGDERARDRDRGREREDRDRDRDRRGTDSERDRDRDRHRTDADGGKHRDRDGRDRDADRERRGDRDRSRADRDGHRDRDRDHQRREDRAAGGKRERDGEHERRPDEKRRRTQSPGQETGRKDSQTGDAAPAYEGPEVMAEDGGDVNLGGDITSDEMQMMMSMGIPFGFDTTQGKHVEDTGANLGAVKTKTTRHARQYMNRRGGFNRPLPAEVTGQKAGRT